MGCDDELLSPLASTRDGRTARLTARSGGVYTGLALLGMHPYASHASPLFLGSSTVEQAAVNRKVTGSNPVRGANPNPLPRLRIRFAPGFFIAQLIAIPPFFRAEIRSGNSSHHPISQGLTAVIRQYPSLSCLCAASLRHFLAHAGRYGVHGPAGAPASCSLARTACAVRAPGGS